MTVTNSVASEGEHGLDPETAEQCAARQELQLDEHGETRHRSAGSPEQFRGCCGGAGSGEHIVDHQHTVARPDRIGVHLDLVGTVLPAVVHPKNQGCSQLPPRIQTKPSGKNEFTAHLSSVLMHVSRGFLSIVQW